MKLITFHCLWPSATAKPKCPQLSCFALCALKHPINTFQSIRDPRLLFKSVQNPPKHASTSILSKTAFRSSPQLHHFKKNRAQACYDPPEAHSTYPQQARGHPGRESTLPTRANLKNPWKQHFSVALSHCSANKRPGARASIPP